MIEKNPSPLPSEQDYLLPFTIAELNIRGRTVQLRKTLGKILERHDYPEIVNHLLGQLLCATALIGTTLKFEGKLSLQTVSDGPIRLLLCDFTAPAQLRAYARFEKNTLQSSIDKQKLSFPELVGKGHLAFNIYHGSSAQLYQGLVSLEGDSLETVIENYFQQSEQIPTKIRLATALLQQNGDRQKTYSAGGMFVQYMPNSSQNHNHLIVENDFQEASLLLNTISPDELTDPTIPPERLLLRLFHNYETRVFDKCFLEEQCSCSKLKLLPILKSFSEEELSNMQKEGKISASCEFCSQDYQFSLEEIQQFLANGKD